MSALKRVLDLPRYLRPEDTLIWGPASAEPGVDGQGSATLFPGVRA